MTSSFSPVEFKGLMHENVDGVFARKPEKKKQPFKLDHKCVSRMDSTPDFVYKGNHVLV